MLAGSCPTLRFTGSCGDSADLTSQSQATARSSRESMSNEVERPQAGPSRSGARWTSQLRELSWPPRHNARYKSTASRIERYARIPSVLEQEPPPESLAETTMSRVLHTLGSLASSTPGVATLSIVATLGASGLYWRYFRRIRNAEYLTPAVLRYRRILVGRCTSVGDGDGFRLYHQPGPPFLRDYLFPVPKTPSALKNATLSVRLAGADAPEMAHFGNPAQPFAKEALEYLKKMALHRTVWLEVSHVDQYKRLVATAYIWDPPYILGRTNISLKMIQEGLAVVYRSGGASYGSATWWYRFFYKVATGEAGLERAEAKAKRQKKGIWSQKRFESPEDYKKRVKGSDHGKA